VNDLVHNIEDTVQEKKELMQEKMASGLIEETTLTGDIGTGAGKERCIGNICSIAPLEEAVEYIIDNIVSDTSIPNVRVSKF
jgi:hypothetical protein